MFPAIKIFIYFSSTCGYVAWELYGCVLVVVSVCVVSMVEFSGMWEKVDEKKI